MPPYYIFPFVIFYFITSIIKSKRSPASARRAQKKTEINGELSWRFIFLSVFLIIAYAILVALATFALDPATSSIKPEWLRQSVVIVSAAVPALLILIWSCPWLAWRIFRPLGLLFLARRFYWFTPGATRRDLENFDALLQASSGVSPAPPPAVKNGLKEKILGFLLINIRPLPFLVDAKTTLMLALAREVRGDYELAERLIRTFELCPPGLETLGIFRSFAFEELAWHAAKRGDWNAVLRRARMGSGRGMLLMRLLAEKHLGRQVNRSGLWLALLISPSRLRAIQMVLDSEKLADGEFRHRSSNRSGIRQTHMLFLSKASEGIPIDLGEIFCLARSWDREFGLRKQENLLRRGMELGARDVLGLCERIEENVLDELEEMAAAAEGEIPREVLAGLEEDGTSYEGRLFFRLRTRLYSDIDTLLSLFRVERDEKVEEGKLLERWETWLSLHEMVSRFHRLIGTEELSTLWYGTLRNEVWNSTVHIFNSHGTRVAFISMIMFNWVAQMCRLLGDEEGSTVNRKNTKLCCDELFVKLSALKKISNWAA